MTIQVAVKRSYTLHPTQQIVHDCPARFRILRAGRRWGKTRLGILEAVESGMGGGRAWWVGPTYKVGEEGWQPLRQMARHWVGVKVREVDKTIEFPNGGLVQIRSATDPTESLIGAGLDFVVLDEAAKLPKAAWYEALRPALADRLGRALFISTPEGHNWFWELHEESVHRGPDWARFHFPSSANPYLPASEIEDMARDMPAISYQQEILAEFVSLKGSRYDWGWARFYTVRDGAVWKYGRNDEGWEGTPVRLDSTVKFCTVDLATSMRTSADWTVIVSCAVQGPDLFVLNLVRRRMEGPDIVPAIVEQVAKHRLAVAHIESAGFQLSVVQEARRKGLPVMELKANKDKVARSLTLEARMQGGNVWLPKEAEWVDGLRRELLAFPFGQYDDQVDALAYAAAVMLSPKLPDWSKAGVEEGLEKVSEWRI